MTYLVSTMDTASFNTDSPNTNILRVGSTSRAWNMARVATGSTAEISDPNVKLHKNQKKKKISINTLLKLFDTFQ